MQVQKARALRSSQRQDGSLSGWSGYGQLICGRPPRNSESVEKFGLAPLDRGANLGGSDKALAGAGGHERVSDGPLVLRRALCSIQSIRSRRR